ncbi:YhcH/YjgK/YiaL family protein [Robertkochia sediminum]|uniref:YhcH/YjgK/YiaL family protein n=1 Tax=Robertkochia sediminum TaxID=2785326 RepID=UPI0019345233|nr:YhcH/YjgK/YiaL family protein [Robertkochia sediminum]MBL7473255.1 YhcH/YjgK/YiaL family protein [Robertkochia sediminum]
MIIDKIENSGKHKGLHSNLDMALEHLNSMNFESLVSGAYGIHGDDVYMIVKEGKTRKIEQSEALLEAHRQYIDLHYVIEGTEQIGVAPLNGGAPVKAYDEKDDYALFKASYEVVTLESGMFAILYPEDLHLPEITMDAVSELKKIVIKVRI